MSKLTFSEFWKWFADYSKPLRTEDELSVFSALFAVYFRGDVNLLDAAMLSAIKVNKEQLPKNLVATYCPGKKHFEELKKTVKECLMPYIPDWFAAAETLYWIILNDPTIHRPEWDDILIGYPLAGEDEIATWLTNVLFCAITPKGHPDTRKGLRPVSIDYIPAPCNWFVGRKNELQDIDEKIKHHTKVFLNGIPGIGKSELAKKYVAKHGREYAEVLWIPCRRSLQQSIADAQLTRDMPGETQNTRFENHLHMLKHITEHGLVVLDNCNWLPEDEPLLDQIMECKCHVLVTTRTYVEERTNLEVKEMDPSELLEIMRYFYKMPAFPQQTMNLLIEKLHRHTYAVELAARLTSKDTPKPREFLVKLMWKRFARDITKAIRNQKDNASQKASYYQTLCDLFALMDLDCSKQEVMRNMTMMPDCGVYHHCLLMLLGLKDDEQVEELERMGLLRWDEDECVVQMLPMVRDIAVEDLKPSIQSCGALVKNITQHCEDYGTDDAHDYLMYKIVGQIIEVAEKDDIVGYWALLCNVFNCMEHIGLQPAMHRIFEAIVDIAETYQLDPIATAQYLDIKAYLEENQYKKVEMEKQALNLLEEAGEGDSELARNILSNLAGAYRMAGDYGQSIQFFERRLQQITTEEQTPLRYNYLTCVCNLAVAYAEIGDYSKALEQLLPVEQQLKALREDNGSVYGMLLETRGHVYAISGQVSEVRKAYEEAIAIWMELYGDQTSLVMEKAKEYRRSVSLALLHGNKRGIALVSG